MNYSDFKEKIIYAIYNIALPLVFIIATPFFLVRIVSGKYRAGFKERFGFLPDSFLDKRLKRIWIHAVSVGEVGAAIPIAREIKKLFSDVEIFFSTTTSTGQEVARKRLDRNVFYYPLDFPAVLRRTLRYVQPDVFVAMETEIWPNLFRQARKTGAAVLLLNARISNSSFQGYREIKFLLKEVFNKVDAFGVQTEEDGERFKRLGVEKGKVIVSGNSKFDASAALSINPEHVERVDSAAIDSSGDRLDYFKSLFRLEEREAIVFGSTHPGEEEIILETCKAISRDYPHLRFILCPRHPERADKVQELVKASSFRTIRRSELKGGRKAEDEDCIILDTIGELSIIYGLAAIVFVGGSLIPKGGQNIIEPAFWGKPILFGPYADNFKEIVKIFLKKGAACQVKGGNEFKEKLIYFLNHKEEAMEMGRRAQALVQANQGASRKNAELVLKYLR